MALKLTIVGAKGLPSVGGTSGDAGSAKLDAFVVCKIAGGGTPTQTPSVKDSANPSWNHSADLAWTSGTDIEFEIHDASTGKHELIGTAVLAGASVAKSKHELPIVTAANGKQGILEVEVKEMPPASDKPPATASAAAATPDPSAAGTAAPAPAGTTPAGTAAPAPAGAAAPAPAGAAAPAPAATADAGKGAAAPAPAPKAAAPAPKAAAEPPAPAKKAPEPAKDTPAKDSKDSKGTKPPEKMTMEQRRAWMDARLEKVDAMVERRAALARGGADRTSTVELGVPPSFRPSFESPLAAAGEAGGVLGADGLIANASDAGSLDAAAAGVSPLAWPTAAPLLPSAYAAGLAPAAVSLPQGYPSAYTAGLAPAAVSLPQGYPSAYAAGLAPAAVSLPQGYPSAYATGVAPAAEPFPQGYPSAYAAGLASAAVPLPDLYASGVAPAATRPMVVGNPPVMPIGVSGLSQDSLRIFGSLPNAGPVATQSSDMAHRLCGALPTGLQYVPGTPEQQLLGGRQGPMEPMLSPAPGSQSVYAAPAPDLKQLIKPIDLWSALLPGPQMPIAG